MYTMDELNDKLLSELKAITEELGIKGASKLSKQDLIYKILDEQAIAKPKKADAKSEKTKEEGLYKPTHIKHPCTIWTGESHENAQWLLKYFRFLSNEYTYRYKKSHKSYTLYEKFTKLLKYIPKKGLTNFANCTRSPGIDYRNEKDTFLAYRKYLSFKWDNDKKPPKWGGRGQPKWYIKKDI